MNYLAVNSSKRDLIDGNILAMFDRQSGEHIMSKHIPHNPKELNRRQFLETAGRGIGLASLCTASIAALLGRVRAATKSIEHLSPEQAAADEDYWFEIQQAFSVT